jgi:hypothetical protein
MEMSQNQDQLQLAASLVDGEERIMSAICRNDVETLKGLMSSDIVLLNGQGGYIEAAPLFEIFKVIRIESFKIEQPQVLTAGERTRVVSYRLHQKGTIFGHPLPEDTFCTSVWEERDGRWVTVFHQETLNQTQQPTA